MNERETALLKSRIAKYTKIIKDNERLPKPERDKSDVADAKMRIRTLSTWLNQATKNDASNFKVPQGKALSKEEWDALVKEHFGDVSDPSFVMEIKTVGEVDRMWSWLKRANCQISANQKIKDYWIAKLRKERKYQQ